MSDNTSKKFPVTTETTGTIPVVPSHVFFNTIRPVCLMSDGEEPSLALVASKEDNIEFYTQENISILLIDALQKAMLRIDDLEDRLYKIDGKKVSSAEVLDNLPEVDESEELESFPIVEPSFVQKGEDNHERPSSINPKPNDEVMSVNEIENETINPEAITVAVTAINAEGDLITVGSDGKLIEEPKKGGTVNPTLVDVTKTDMLAQMVSAEVVSVPLKDLDS